MKKYVAAGALALVLLGAVVFYFFNHGGRSQRLRAKRGDVVESIYGLGTVTSDKFFNLRTGVSLSVKKLYVKEGETVKAGAPLIQLDEQIFKTPIDGTVTLVAYKEGEIVPPAIPIVTVTNLSQLFLEVSLEQQSILRVKKDQTVYVSFENLRNERAEGKVQSVYPRDVQFIVKIQMPSWPSGVLPGMTADVAILVGKKSGAVLIPISSIAAGRVTRLRDGKKETVPVKLGALDGEWAEVVSDNINETDELIGRK